ncbi:aminoglycoside phosphotransferase family protein [Saccharibacillus sp. CPCC 101409]|uniref:phosphotransferase enzyme family protein n=1 Tax=Saccharibacillus sp. CPCC 101409 TaxID=3058041 RepID=UPI002673DE53|nr:aminoglycoside phosphotransferase family protein [Saccharibacillus sp. CPCC 101409]MDO3410838.1 aminoglycoside phosphotransferase family protein [Saccharibacillus sp. CPCC 101409]
MAQLSPEAQAAARGFGIGHIRSENNASAGISSGARLIASETGIYVLRRMRGREQALTEYRIAEALKGRSVCPEIRIASDGNPWIESESAFYNLQHYIEPLPPGAVVVDFEELGAKAGLLHTALSGLELDAQPDRFELQSKWSAFLARYPGAERNAAVKRIGTAVSACSEAEDAARAARSGQEKAAESYIHGDLGRWNLVFGAEGARIIDFGEVRRGDRHFDLAALLVSTLELKGTETARRNLRAFKRGYEERAIRIEDTLLHAAIRLWNVRGAAALLESRGPDEKVLRYAESLLVRVDDYEKLLFDKESGKSQKVQT